MQGSFGKARAPAADLTPDVQQKVHPQKQGHLRMIQLTDITAQNGH